MGHVAAPTPTDEDFRSDTWRAFEQDDPRPLASRVSTTGCRKDRSRQTRRARPDDAHVVFVTMSCGPHSHLPFIHSASGAPARYYGIEHNFNEKQLQQAV
jgi:hypothetical protein